MGLHSYNVKYIERDGHVAVRIVMASRKAEARQKASDAGCDDILSVRRANFFHRNLIRLLVIVVIAVIVWYLV
ncbi:MAG: hypothetical protein IKF72_05755 [Kiritimatiellae bacterium]|nr:hypothetical protein [Kiritimatiellia bacterium]